VFYDLAPSRGSQAVQRVALFLDAVLLGNVTMPRVLPTSLPRLRLRLPLEQIQQLRLRLPLLPPLPLSNLLLELVIAV